jgi:hypothetical protein
VCSSLFLVESSVKISIPSRRPDFPINRDRRGHTSLPHKKEREIR